MRLGTRMGYWLRSFDETIELRRAGGRACVEYLRAGAKRAHVGRGCQLFLDPAGAADVDACRQGRGHRGVFVRLSGVQFIRAYHAQIEGESAAEYGVRFPAGVLQSKRGQAHVSARFPTRSDA